MNIWFCVKVTNMADWFIYAPAKENWFCNIAEALNVSWLMSGHVL